MRPERKHVTTAVSTTALEQDENILEDKPIRSASEIKPVQTQKPEAYFGITGIPSIVDSVLRAVGRFIESYLMKEKPMARLGFRYCSETVRYGLSRLVKNINEKTTTAKEIWVKGLKKAVEITIGSAVIEPNMFEERMERVGAGFLNAAVRIGGRNILAFTKILDRGSLNLKALLDEFISRTSARLLYFNTDSPYIRMGMLTLEQIFINEWLAKMPMKEHIVPWLEKKECELKTEPRSV